MPDVLVIPRRVVPRLRDLDATELAALMSSVQHVGNVIERVYGADALTVACQVRCRTSAFLLSVLPSLRQDGKAAGQTVPHVHFHLLPRKLHGDRFASRNDEVYPALERSESELPAELASVASGSPAPPAHSEKEISVPNIEPLRMDADEDRKPRTMEEMIQEAEWLKRFFTEVQENSA